MTPTINLILSVLTALTQATLALAVVASVLDFKRMRNLAGKYLTPKTAIRVAFVVALVSMCGSLYYSEFAGFVPCDLCWFQRIFMYPSAVILGIALLKHEETIIDYVLGLAGIGLLFSLYHNSIIYSTTESGFCSFKSVSCTTKVVLGLGYVTIPLMALTAFLAIIAVLLTGKLVTKSAK